MAPDRAVLEAAATWYVQFSASPPDAAEHQAWRQWLEADPAHQRAWERVERLQNQWSALPTDLALDTLAGAHARRRAVLKTVALLVGAGGMGWLASTRLPYPALLADLHTGVGERRQLRLADGSQLDLNTDTALDMAFDGHLRQLYLRQGEILVQTAADPAGRPFLVHTAQGSIRALGTRFSVRCEDLRSRVCVLEHAVELRPLHAPQAPQRLDAGQQASFDAAHVYPASPLRPGEGAWAQGMLTVVDWALSDFIAELGRYRHGLLRCDPAVAGLRLSGAYRLDQIDVILQNLGKSLPVRVHYRTRYWVTVEAA